MQERLVPAVEMENAEAQTAFQELYKRSDLFLATGMHVWTVRMHNHNHPYMLQMFASGAHAIWLKYKCWQWLIVYMSEEKQCQHAELLQAYLWSMFSMHKAAMRGGAVFRV